MDHHPPPLRPKTPQAYPFVSTRQQTTARAKSRQFWKVVVGGDEQATSENEPVTTIPKSFYCSAADGCF
jgi:hypothetical protein